MSLGLDGGTSRLDGGGPDGDMFAADASGPDTGASGPLTILDQPENVTVTDGQPASFSVTARGAQPLQYQWERDNTPMPGATAATLVIPTTIYKYHNGTTTYNVVVTDAAHSQLTSQAATLTVTPRPPVITEAPLSQTVVPNSTATFSVSANGSIPLTYAWSLNGLPISGATAPSYTTGANTAHNNQDSYAVTVTNGANQTTTSPAAVVTVAAPTLPPSITVDCTEIDAVVAHQVTYRRGVDDPFDLNRAPSAIVGNVTADIQSSEINFLNATLDIDLSPDAPLFSYMAPSLTPSASGNAPLLQTFAMLGANVPSGTLGTVVQVSGTPAAYASNLDPNYAASCGCGSCAGGNFYPLPTPGTSMQVVQNAAESWIGTLNASFPDAIWIGTQEPSHTLGYSTSFYDSDAGCSLPPAADSSTAMATNIQRFVSYWTPIAQYLRANHILSGGVQLNAGNSVFYVSTATQIVSAQMPLDYFTIQDYSPAPAVNQALYAAYQEFQQSPDYLGVKVILDRYGISLTETSHDTYGAAAGVIDFLGDEAQLMPYSDMMYGYDVEEIGLQGTAGPTMLPAALQWLHAAPAPLRPLTSTTSDLQAFALVQKSSPQRAYVAIWNVSPSNAYTTSVVLNDLGASFTASNLTVLKGSGTNLTTLNDAGITVSGDEITGLSLNANEFLLIGLE